MELVNWNVRRDTAELWLILTPDESVEIDALVYMIDERYAFCIELLRLLYVLAFVKIMVVDNVETLLCIAS
jgi:hypothetical protein